MRARESTGRRGSAGQREDMDQRERKRKREAQRRRREQEIKRNIAILAAAGGVLLIVIAGAVSARIRAAREERRREQERQEREASLLSEDVLGYKDLVYEYAQEEGIEGHEDVLLAIMEVESKGTGNDVMQSSESKGLRAGTLGPEESIAQACYYYAELLKIAEEHGCDEKSVIQAYNFGPGYLLFIGERGGKHSQELAREYAAQKSGGATVTYTNDISEEGWIYKYGNMYYEALVQQHLPE